MAELPNSELTKPGEMDSPEVIARSIKNLENLKFRPPPSPVLGETVPSSGSGGDLGNILRVFPRRTSRTPTDEMVFIGDPPLERPPADEVHVSCCFSWDKAKAERLQMAWAQYYPVVKLGGPAYGSGCDDFVPGRYIKTGVTFTSRGCNNHCDFCLVPEREGRLQVIDDFPAGNIIQDNNLLQTGKAHIGKVFEMLKHQHGVVFSGGIEADLVTNWFADRLKDLRIKKLFMACDSSGAIYPLRKAMQKLSFLTRNKVFCYVLIGKDDLSIGTAKVRLESVWDAGCMPFAQLYQPADHRINYPSEWRSLARMYSRPAVTKAVHRDQG